MSSLMLIILSVRLATPVRTPCSHTTNINTPCYRSDPAGPLSLTLTLPCLPCSVPPLYNAPDL